jgi:putative membrane protein
MKFGAQRYKSLLEWNEILLILYLVYCHRNWFVLVIFAALIILTRCTSIMDLYTYKALHLIFMVSWFAGLFYVVRLFIYHTESYERPEIEGKILQNQFQIMERKLWYIITWPAMILTLAFGVAMLVTEKSYLSMPWMHLKLLFVALLVVYHIYCHKLFRQFQRNERRLTSTQLRVFNEVATLILVAVVFIVVKKSALNWLYGTIGFFGVAVGLMIAIQWYKRLRNR